MTKNKSRIYFLKLARIVCGPINSNKVIREMITVTVKEKITNFFFKLIRIVCRPINFNKLIRE